MRATCPIEMQAAGTEAERGEFNSLLVTDRLLNFHTLYSNEGMLKCNVSAAPVGLRISSSSLLTAGGALIILMKLARFAVLMDSLLEQYSNLTCYSHVAVMACIMKVGHCVTHMSTT
jgi:hypothetical protein